MAMTYTSKNQDEIDRLSKEYTNREKFSYDPTTDEAYQNYAKMARQEGAKAMEDTMGRAASMTGGYGNSYGATAGGQVYRDYLRDIDAKADDYYAMALDKYNAEGNDILSRLNVAQQKESTERTAWESEYQREWDAAIQGAAYGNTDALAGLLGMDNTQLRSAMGIGGLSDAQIEGYKQALMNGRGDEYLVALDGYDTSSLPTLAQQWVASGELDGTVDINTGSDGKPTATYTPHGSDSPSTISKKIIKAESPTVPDWENNVEADVGDFLTIRLDGKDYNLELFKKLDKDGNKALYEATRDFEDRSVFYYGGNAYIKADGEIFGLRNNFLSTLSTDYKDLVAKIAESKEDEA